MDRKLVLHVPTIDELWHRERIMSDPATMAYNAAMIWVLMSTIMIPAV